MITRAELLRSALLATLAGGAGAVAPALAQQRAGDVEVLELALMLERLEGELYRRAVREVPDLSRTARAYARDFGRHELEHEKAIEDLLGRLGAEVPEDPTFRLDDALRDEASFLRTMQLLEDTGVGAYNAAGPLLLNRDVLAIAGSIVQVEGRHAGAIRDLRGEDPSPSAFDAPVPGPEALRRAAPFVA